MPASLVTPLTPPYTAETDAMLRRWMPPGAPFGPLALFRSMAKNEELMTAMRSLGSYFLGPRSCLPLRLREMIILRTCVKASCEYEWGVHVTGFAAAAELSAVDIQELTFGAAESPHWSAPEQAVLQACDQLATTANIDAATRGKLQNCFDDASILAIVTLAGWYRLIAGLANTVCEEGESWAACFKDYR
jgi:4-carboxymuconolactone decarboxylase